MLGLIFQAFKKFRLCFRWDLMNSLFECFSGVPFIDWFKWWKSILTLSLISFVAERVQYLAIKLSAFSRPFSVGANLSIIVAQGVFLCVDREAQKC